MTDNHFEVLHALRVKGFATAPAIAEMQTRPHDDVAAALDALHARELVRYREGAVSGWRLTPTGTAHHEELLVAHRATADHGALHVLHEAFMPLNLRLKQLCTDWQMRNGEMNDHTDAAHDAAVVEGVQQTHEEVAEVLDAHAPAFTRVAWYSPRLRRACDRFAAGDATALTRPLSESYHDVWMELHQDLILTLGLTRGDADT